jgi:dipeptidyl aminopeptidase/acylaminoacyl peptidase
MSRRFERRRLLSAVLGGGAGKPSDDRESHHPKVARTIAVLTALFLALVFASCNKAPTARRNVETFSYQITVGSNDYHIEGYLALAHEPGRWPALLVLNGGEGDDARRCIRQSGQFTAMNIQVACISIPGYGRSSGPSRFVGRQAVKAARRAFDMLVARRDVDPHRIAVWGLSRGAMAAGLLMDSDPRPRAVILESGAYDLLSLWPRAPLRTKLAILREVWPSRRILAERSVIAHLPPRLECSVLILHGVRDRQVPLRQAMRLASALRERGAKIQTLYFPTAGHDLGKRVDPALKKFLQQSLLDRGPNATS